MGMIKGCVVVAEVRGDREVTSGGRTEGESEKEIERRQQLEVCGVVLEVWGQRLERERHLITLSPLSSSFSSSLLPCAGAG